MFSGYDPKSRFCKQSDVVSRTVQDVVVDVLGLFEQFAGKLPDLFRQYDNGLLYESDSGVGVFIDELNADEVKAFEDYKSKLEKQKADEEETNRLFDEWKADKAKQVLESRSTTPVTVETSASASNS